ANYDFSFVAGELTITQASTTNTVASSANPALPGATVTFTATLNPVAPSSGTPTVAVQFKTNGVAAGDPVTLTNRSASFSTSSLNAGTNTVTAEYPGDANFIGST